VVLAEIKDPLFSVRNWRLLSVFPAGEIAEYKNHALLIHLRLKNRKTKCYRSSSTTQNIRGQKPLLKCIDEFPALSGN
jgi:hypothetical protein